MTRNFERRKGGHNIVNTPYIQWDNKYTAVRLHCSLAILLQEDIMLYHIQRTFMIVKEISKMATFTWELAKEILWKMVYFDSWDEFAAAVEQLCVAEPRKVRDVLCTFKLNIQFISSLFTTRVWFISLTCD